MDADIYDDSGEVMHVCDHEDGKTPHRCRCALNRDHTADEYEDWLEWKPLPDTSA